MSQDKTKLRTKLKELYSHKSKHSNYQILPKMLLELIDEGIEVKTRYEAERLAYILKNIDVTNKCILDIGGNTGYFTFEMLENGARNVHYYEGEKSHAEFVRLSSQYLNMNSRLKITNQYFSFAERMYEETYDIILLLNVLHHIGDDYGDATLSIERAKSQIIRQLNSLAEISEVIVFQLGFNWKGNREICLFDHGTKKEMIEFIKGGTKNHWEIYKIGIAESKEGGIEYCDANEKNMERLDRLGEFLNRPIIIMKSLKRNQ